MIESKRHDVTSHMKRNKLITIDQHDVVVIYVMPINETGISVIIKKVKREVEYEYQVICIMHTILYIYIYI